MASIEQWKKIEEYPKYDVSIDGRIRRVYKNGKIKILSQYKKSGQGRITYRDRLIVKLSDSNGKFKEVLVHHIVAKSFLSKPKEGHVVYHKNGCVMDNWASNLGYISRKELGKLTGASSRRKPVVKIDMYGEIADCYSSARECARKNYMSYQTVIDRCNLVSVKRSMFAPDGFAYAWEDNEKIFKKTMEMVRREVSYTNPRLN